MGFAFRKTVGAIGMASALAASTAFADTLTIAAISETSDTYMLAVGWSNVLKKIKSEHAMTPISGGGTIKLLRGVADGKWDIGFISTPHFSQAVEGKSSFKDDPAELRAKYGKVRALFGITSGMGLYVVRADSGIRTMADLKGRVVSHGQPGGGGARITPLLLKHHGLAADDYRPVFLTDQAALDEMRNGKVHVATVWGGVPQPSVLSFSRSFPVRFLSLDPQAFEAFRKEMPGGNHFVLRSFEASELKKAYGTGIEQEGRVSFFTFPMQVVVRPDMPDAVVYGVVKAFWQNVADVKAVGAALSNIDHANALEALSAEIHPGAARFYREQGWMK